MKVFSELLYEVVKFCRLSCELVGSPFWFSLIYFFNFSKPDHLNNLSWSIRVECADVFLVFRFLSVYIPGSIMDSHHLDFRFAVDFSARSCSRW